MLKDNDIFFLTAGNHLLRAGNGNQVNQAAFAIDAGLHFKFVYIW